MSSMFSKNICADLTPILVSATSSINELLVCSVWPGETVEEAQIKRSECDELRSIFSSSNGKLSITEH